MGLFSAWRVFGLGAVALRLLSALVCGMAIGLDREMRNKKAGLKTHALVCLGAALCVIVSECIVLGRTDITTDMTRVAANVVTGVGFLCAATLMVKGNGSLSGLTTAAGLWATSIIGLACGAGWPEVGLLATCAILFVFFVLSRVDERVERISRGFDLYCELTHHSELPTLLDTLHECEVHFSGLQVKPTPVGDGALVQLTGHTAHLGEKEFVLRTLRELDCVRYLESF